MKFLLRLHDHITEIGCYFMLHISNIFSGRIVAPM
uniref:Uncharacterized protein n=1 Tax=Setaria italica TaxID=4555 RepID=K3YNM5_SETIT